VALVVGELGLEVLVVVREVELLGRPERRLGLFVEAPDVVVLEREYDEPVRVRRQEGLRDGARFFGERGRRLGGGTGPLWRQVRRILERRGHGRERRGVVVARCGSTSRFESSLTEA